MDIIDHPLVLAPGVLTAAAAFAGARTRRPLSDPAVLISIVLVAILSTCWVVAESRFDDGVAVGRAVEGIAIFVAGFALPLLVFYFAGLKLAAHPVVLAGGWLLLLYPVYIYLVLVLLFGADLAFCAPDAYECPV